MNVLYLAFIVISFFLWLIFVELLKPKYIFIFAIIVISIVIINTYFFSPYKIPAKSMIPSLMPGDRIIVNKFFYQTREPRPGDVILFELPRNPDQIFIKRLIGLPGDKVEINSKVLYINDKPIHESYALNLDTQVIPKETQPRDFFGPVRVPRDHLFMLGDNRDYSSDSRFWGFLPANGIKGKVVMVYWSRDNATGNIRWGRIGKCIH